MIAIERIKRVLKQADVHAPRTRKAWLEGLPASTRKQIRRDLRELVRRHDEARAAGMPVRLSKWLKALLRLEGF